MNSRKSLSSSRRSSKLNRLSNFRLRTSLIDSLMLVRTMSKTMCWYQDGIRMRCFGSLPHTTWLPIEIVLIKAPSSPAEAFSALGGSFEHL